MKTQRTCKFYIERARVPANKPKRMQSILYVGRSQLHCMMATRVSCHCQIFIAGQLRLHDCDIGHLRSH